MKLYRGQREAHPVGLSWTRSDYIAVKFALYGLANVNVFKLHRAKHEPYRDGVVLSTIAHSEIICAPCLLGHEEGEFILDPRGLNYATQRVMSVDPDTAAWRLSE